jgi:hypothetical protein
MTPRPMLSKRLPMPIARSSSAPRVSNRPVTGSVPTTYRKPQASTVRMSATIWLSVSDDKVRPIDRYAPASSSAAR